MKVKDDFFQRGSFRVGNGQSTRFWEDTWLGDTPLADQYSMLYNVVRRKNVLVADVLAHIPLNIEFQRTLSGNKWDAWLITINLSQEEDKFVWKINPSGFLMVKFMYADYINGHTVFLKSTYGN